MAIKLSGEFQVKRKPEEVYDFLTDPKKFAPLLPDYRDMTQQDASHFTVRVEVGISHIKGTAEMNLQLAEAEHPRRARYQGQGRVAGGNVSLSAGFELQPSDAGTRVVWLGEAQIFGRLASLAGGLLEPLTKKNVQRLIDGLEAALQ